MSRVGEVWDVEWHNYPSQLMLVVHHDLEERVITILDLESGAIEEYDQSLVDQHQPEDGWTWPFCVRVA